MNNDTNKSQDNQNIGGVGLPPIPNVPEVPPSPTPPMPSVVPTPPVTTSPIKPVVPATTPEKTSVTPAEPKVDSGLPELPKIEVKVTEAPTMGVSSVEEKIEDKKMEVTVKTSSSGEQKPKRKMSKRAVIASAIMAIFVAVLGVLAYQLPQFSGEQRGRACLSCPGGSCPDGFTYGPDTCSPQASCDQRAQEACSGHQSGGGGCTNPGPAPCSTTCVNGSTFSDSCLPSFGSCSQWATEACATVGSTPGGGTGGGGGTGLCVTGSHQYCVDKAPGSVPAPDGTQGFCFKNGGTDAAPLCGWDFATICSPGSCDNQGGGIWKKCYDGSAGQTPAGTRYKSECYSQGCTTQISCTGGGSTPSATATQAPTATATQAPTATATPPGTGGGTPAPCSAQGLTACGPAAEGSIQCISSAGTLINCCPTGRQMTQVDGSWKCLISPAGDGLGGCCDPNQLDSTQCSYQNYCIVSNGECSTGMSCSDSSTCEAQTNQTTCQNLRGGGACTWNNNRSPKCQSVSGACVNITSYTTCTANSSCFWTGPGQVPGNFCFPRIPSGTSGCCSTSSDCPSNQTCPSGTNNGACASGKSCIVSPTTCTANQCYALLYGYWRKCNSTGTGYLSGTYNNSSCTNTVSTVTCTCVYGSETGAVGPATCSNGTTQSARAGCKASGSTVGGGSGTCAGVLQPCESQSCCDGLNLVCQGTTGSRVCQQTAPGGSGDAWCRDTANGGGANGTCTKWYGFKCSSLSATGECLDNGTLFNTQGDAKNYAGGCGQVDQVCDSNSGDRAGKLCGSFEIVNTSCGGGGGTPTDTPTTTTTTTPGVACVNTRIFINGSTTAATQAQMNALRIGDTIRMVVQGNSPTLVGGRFIVRINGNDVSGGGFLVTANLTPIQASGAREFYYDYPITLAGTYAIEGYVNTIPPTATATTQPTATITGTGVAGECTFTAGQYCDVTGGIVAACRNSNGREGVGTCPDIGTQRQVCCAAITVTGDGATLGANDIRSPLAVFVDEITNRLKNLVSPKN